MITHLLLFINQYSYLVCLFEWLDSLVDSTLAYEHGYSRIKSQQIYLTSYGQKTLSPTPGHYFGDLQSSWLWIALLEGLRL